VPAEHSTRRHKPLITVGEAARRLGLSQSAAYRLAASDALPGLVRLPGTRMWVRGRVLHAWLNGEDLAGAVIPDVPAAKRRHGRFGRAS
jgi:excisionase family DNA binding protein